jgi:hypothetical protein
MKCFYHAGADAVGICKNCSRGVCAACANERDDGLACRDRCETKVDAITNLVQRNVRLTAGASRTSALALLVFVIGCVVFSWLAFQNSDPTMRLMLSVLAAIMLVCALGNIRVVLSRGRVHTNT